jgi:four helix bundle protein
MYHNYKKLNIWLSSIELAELIYQVTKGFPKEEIFGLQSQIRRAAISIPSNIAEGSGRDTIKDFKYFLAISNGSCNELETQFIVANKLNYINEKELNDIQRMIYTFKNSLR